MMGVKIVFGEIGPEGDTKVLLEVQAELDKMVAKAEQALEEHTEAKENGLTGYEFFQKQSKKHGLYASPGYSRAVIDVRKMLSLAIVKEYG